MMDWFQGLDPLLQIVVLIVGLSLIWTVIKAVFKIATRLFTCGILVILALAAVLYITSALG